MNAGIVTWTLALALILSTGTGAASAQPTTSLAGDGTYRLYCATCHGPRGKGNGPLAGSQERTPVAERIGRVVKYLESLQVRP